MTFFFLTLEIVPWCLTSLSRFHDKASVSETRRLLVVLLLGCENNWQIPKWANHVFLGLGKYFCFLSETKRQRIKKKNVLCLKHTFNALRGYESIATFTLDHNAVFIDSLKFSLNDLCVFYYQNCYLQLLSHGVRWKYWDLTSAILILAILSRN